MRVVVAIDSFKGCVTSKDANQAAAEGAKKAWPDAEIVQVPVSDGGEGFLEAFHAAIGGEIVESAQKLGLSQSPQSHLSGDTSP